MATLRSLSITTLCLLLLLLPGCESDDDMDPGPIPDSVTIDPFSTTVAATTDVMSIQSDDILGGELDVIPLNTVTQFEQTGGAATFSSTAGAMAQVEFQYDGVEVAGVNPFDLGPSDLTAAGQATQFEVIVSDFSCTQCTIKIWVLDSDNDQERSPVTPITGVGAVLIPFSSFTTVGAGEDFASTDMIVVALDISGNDSISIDSIRAVP